MFHPIIRTHPETGRKSLYFDPGKIVSIVGAQAEESDALVEELTGYMIQPEAEYRHQWRKGDAVIWDNRCSYHKAAGDYPPEEDRIPLAGVDQRLRRRGWGGCRVALSLQQPRCRKMARNCGQVRRLCFDALMLFQ